MSLSQLVGAGNANGDDEKIDASSNKNNIHAWTFLAWCIVNITNIEVDDNNDNSNSNDNEETKRPSSSSISLSSFSSTTTSTTTTLFTHDLRETVMRRLQGAEATAIAIATTTATAANNDGSTADATATAATTTTTAQHNTRLWTSSSSPNILLV